MRYHNITKDDMRNGNGLRVVLWVSGCLFHCPNCHNPVTWDENSGLKFDQDAFDEICEQLDKDYIDGITLSGGDPLHPANRDDITILVEKLKYLYPNKTIWMYTGNLYDDVKDLECMKYIDVLCDGRFVEALKDVKTHWVGSTNQRVIDIKKTRRENQIVLWG